MTPLKSIPPELPKSSAHKIMVVDDTLANLTLIKTMLSNAGFEVFAFPSGAMALRASEKFVPDLVLLDINMPEMDGYDVCSQFKKNPRLIDVPIIFLSALSETTDKLTGFKAGCVDFITKPFQYEEVHARVTLHLSIRELQQRLEYQNEHLQELVDAKVQQLTEAKISLLVEQRRRAEAVKESQQRLAELAHLNRNATATIYSAALAHELNQPLAAIMSNAEAAEIFLKKNPPMIADVLEILADIRRDDLRASGLIQQMRNLLKKSESALSEFDVHELVNDVVKFLSHEAAARQVRVTVDVTPQLSLLSADRIQLQQVMINLIINSMDAMIVTPSDQRAITIHIAALDPSHAQVTVADSGPGFSSNIGQIFQSFFTTKPQGMGLGLSITAAIIQAHGGKIYAENRPQGGALVRFNLPYKNPLDSRTIQLGE